MADESSHPLTPAEAKTRLRQAAHRASPAGLVTHYPWQSVGLALIGGYAIGRGKLRPVLSQRWVTQLLWRMVSEGLEASVHASSSRPRKK